MAGNIVSYMVGLFCLLIATKLQDSSAVMDVEVEFGPNRMKEVLGQFSTIRNHIHPLTKDKVRKYISHWINMNVLSGKATILMETQRFATPGLRYSNGSNVPGVNYILWTMGNFYGMKEDKPILVAAHYDSKSSSPGVDDNGSGMAVLMEAYRLMLDARNAGLRRVLGKCTVHFVAFDMGEYDHEGSRIFLNDYYVPDFLKKHNVAQKDLRIIILDSLMNFDEAEDSQDIPHDSYVEQNLPVFHSTITGNGKIGNFILVLSRQNDASLAEEFLTVYNNVTPKYGHEKFKAYHMGLQVKDSLRTWPKEAQNLVTDAFNYEQMSFWNYSNVTYSQTGIKSILLTDTGRYRGKMRECQKKACDNMTTMATETNIEFLIAITKVLAQFLVEKSTGETFNITYVEKETTSVAPPGVQYLTSTSTALLGVVIFINFFLTRLPHVYHSIEC